MMDAMTEAMTFTVMSLPLIICGGANSIICRSDLTDRYSPPRLRPVARARMRRRLRFLPATSSSRAANCLRPRSRFPCSWRRGKYSARGCREGDLLEGFYEGEPGIIDQAIERLWTDRVDHFLHTHRPAQIIG